MHRVLQSHVNEFKTTHSLEMKDAELFEAFGAYTLASLYSCDAVEPENLIYEGPDPGIDSVMFFANERCIITKE